MQNRNGRGRKARCYAVTWNQYSDFAHFGRLHTPTEKMPFFSLAEPSQCCMLHLRYKVLFFVLTRRCSWLSCSYTKPWPLGIFSYVSDIMSRQLTFCERVIASLLCVIFTALHVMQTRYSDKNSVCPSVRPSHA